MSRLERWLRFNAVGASGFVLQMGLVWMLARGLRWNAGLAAAAAVECTLLWNFLLHRQFVFRAEANAGRALLRFHLSNGVVSLTGNALLTPLLLRWGVPLLAANAAAVAACSLINFALAAAWVFQPGREPVLSSSVHALEAHRAASGVRTVDCEQGCPCYARGKRQHGATH